MILTKQDQGQPRFAALIAGLRDFIRARCCFCKACLQQNIFACCQHANIARKLWNHFRFVRAVREISAATTLSTRKMRNLRAAPCNRRAIATLPPCCLPGCTTRVLHVCKSFLQVGTFSARFPAAHK